MSTVGFETRGRIAILTLQREHKRNAVDAALAAALDGACNRFEDEPALWVGVLTGGPSVFSAGTDLSTGPGPPTQRGGEYGIIRRRRTKPLVAAVEGVAFGGGFEIAMACDLVVAAETARFALPEVKRGVIANSGALFRAARLLPPNLAKVLLLTGAEMSAEELHRWGFVNRVTPTGRALEVAIELAESIAANAPVSVSQTLQAVDHVLSGDDDAGWEATARGQEAVMASEDLMEGITAFFERRAPNWKGR